MTAAIAANKNIIKQCFNLCCSVDWPIVKSCKLLVLQSVGKESLTKNESQQKIYEKTFLKKSSSIVNKRVRPSSQFFAKSKFFKKFHFLKFSEKNKKRGFISVEIGGIKSI